MEEYPKWRSIVDSTAYRGATLNKPFLEYVQRSVNKGVPQELAYRLTWSTYYMNGKDDLLGENRNSAGRTAAEQRVEDRKSPEQHAAEGLLKLGRPGGRRFKTSSQRRFKTSSQRRFKTSSQRRFKTSSRPLTKKRRSRRRA